MSSHTYRFQTRWTKRLQRLRDADAGNSRWTLRVIVIRYLTAHLALIGFILFAAAIRPWNDNFVHIIGPSWDWQDTLPIVPLAVSFLYNIFTTVYVLWREKLVHHLLHIAVDLFLWIVFIPAITLPAWGGTFNLWGKQIDLIDDVPACSNGVDTLTKACYPDLYQIGELELAGVVFSIVVWIMHTFLLVYECFERARLRRYSTAEGKTFGWEELEGKGHRLGRF
ncbi:hypothetical protein V8E54_007370 [Elaphomyces granulatus]